MMITMTKALDRLRWTLMDDRGRADETCPKWHPQVPRDKTKKGKEQAEKQQMTLLCWLPACSRACLGAWCLHTFLPPTFER